MSDAGGLFQIRKFIAELPPGALERELCGEGIFIATENLAPCPPQLVIISMLLFGRHKGPIILRHYSKISCQSRGTDMAEFAPSDSQ